MLHLKWFSVGQTNPLGQSFREITKENFSFLIISTQVIVKELLPDLQLFVALASFVEEVKVEFLVSGVEGAATQLLFCDQVEEIVFVAALHKLFKSCDQFGFTFGGLNHCPEVLFVSFALLR